MKREEGGVGPGPGVSLRRRGVVVGCGVAIHPAQEEEEVRGER